MTEKPRVIDRLRATIAARSHPRLAWGLVGGIAGLAVAVLSLVAAVVIGLAVSSVIGVALTWIAVIVGAASALAFTIGLLGYPLAWGADTLR